MLRPLRNRCYDFVVTSDEVPVASRERILVASLDYVLDRGLVGLSLRPLAASIGTSDRMIIYHFRTKAGLVDAVIDRANRLLTESVATSLLVKRDITDMTVFAWDYLATDTGDKIARLYVELCALSMRDPDRWTKAHRAMRGSWMALLNSTQPEPSDGIRDSTLSRLVLDVFDGLLLDALTTGDRQSARAALDQFLEMI